MKCAVLQPSYLPWRGFFHQVQKADVFVFYDDVQYDKHGWRNRNRIKTSDGPRWLTIPVSARGNVVNGLPINQVRIADRKWPAKHLASIRQSYAKAPHVDRCMSLIEPLLLEEREYLADLTVDLTVALAGELGIQSEFVRSSALDVGGDRMDRLMGVLDRVGASHYISGPAARDYMDEGRLEQAGITLEYMEYDYPEYSQLHPPYEPQVSVVDLIAMEGDAAPARIWGA